MICYSQQVRLWTPLGKSFTPLRLIRGQGGGLTLASTGMKTCPLGIIQERLEVKHGLPVKFIPVTNVRKRSRSMAVNLSRVPNIRFAANTKCKESTVWKVRKYDELAKQFLTVGGFEENPGAKTISNWLKIEKVGENYYELVFCPSVCKYCKVVCRDVWIILQNRVRRLALSDEALLVMFKKVD